MYTYDRKGPKRGVALYSYSAEFGLTKTLAKELAARNITCNAVAPGFVETDMTASLPLNREAVEKSIPLHRYAKAEEEVAKLVGFLASDGADYITGEVIRIDGGIAI